CKPAECDSEAIRPHLVTPRADRIDWIRSAMLSGMTVEQVQEATNIDPWFLDQLAELIAHEKELAEHAGRGLDQLDATFLRRTKALGYSDRQIAAACPGKVTEWAVRDHRKRLG